MCSFADYELKIKGNHEYYDCYLIFPKIEKGIQKFA